MKKVRVFVLVVGLVASLVGCSMPVPVADSSVEEAPSSSVVMDTASEAPASSEEPTESAIPEPASSVDAQQPASSTSGSSSASQSTGNQPSSSSQAQPPASSQPPATSAPPAPPQPQAPPPASSQPPATSQAPAEPPAPKTAYDAPYDTATIITNAQNYGGSIGMTWSDGLNMDNCSWEAPISTSTVLCGDRLREAIESGIRRVKKLQEDNGYQPGEFHFKLYMEASGGEYRLYFLMG